MIDMQCDMHILSVLQMLVKLVRTFIGAYSKSQMPQLLSKNISLESVGENNGRLHFLT